MLVLLVFAFFLNQVFDGAASYMILLIRAMQILLHLSILNVDFPAIASDVYEKIVPIALYDIVNLLSEFQFYDDFQERVMGDVNQSQL